MANLGSNDTAVEGTEFALPAGASLDEDAGDLVIRDSGGSVVFRRDEAAGEWVLDSLSTDELNNVVTPQKYGAVGDGQTDDTQAFRDMDADIADGTSVYIPPGDYLLQTVGSDAQNQHFVKWSTNDLKVYGAGWGATRIFTDVFENNAETSLFKFSGERPQVGYLHLDGPGTGTANQVFGHHMQAAIGTSCFTTNVKATNMGAYGLDASVNGTWYVSNCVVTDCGSAAILQSSSVGSMFAFGNWIERCNIGVETAGSGGGVVAMTHYDNQDAKNSGIGLRPQASSKGYLFIGGEIINCDRGIGENTGESDNKFAYLNFENVATMYRTFGGNADSQFWGLTWDNVDTLVNGGTTRPRWEGVIGGGPFGGVDVGSVTGALQGDEALSNGTNASAAADEKFILKSNGDWQSIADPTTTITPA